MVSESAPYLLQCGGSCPFPWPLTTVRPDAEESSLVNYN